MPVPATAVDRLCANAFHLRHFDLCDSFAGFDAGDGGLHLFGLRFNLRFVFVGPAR